MGREILEFWTSLVTEPEHRWQILVARIPGQEMNSGMEELVLVAVVAVVQGSGSPGCTGCGAQNCEHRSSRLLEAFFEGRTRYPWPITLR